MKNPAIKKAYAESEWTPELIQELSLCAADPIHCIVNYAKVQHQTRGVVPFDLYDYQKEVIQALLDNRCVVVLQARQTGKCVFSETSINICTKPTNWFKMKLLKILDKRLYEKIK